MAAVWNNRRVLRILGWSAVWWGIGLLLTVWMVHATGRVGFPAPSWGALAADVSMFAAIAWVIGRVPVAIGRAHQRRRLYARAEEFRCLKCGYPLKDRARGSPCPECGEALGWLP